MSEVNIYLQSLNDSSLTIAKNVRGWGAKGVKLWVCEEDLRNSSSSSSSSPSPKKLVPHWRDARIIDQNIQVNNSIGYYEWNVKEACVNPITSSGLKALVHRCRIQSIQFVILGENAKSKNRFYAFVDAMQDETLPDGWQTYEWVMTYDELLELCKKRGVFEFDLANNKRFAPTNKKEQGAQIYKDIKSGNFIYMDQLHKTHYEVFNPQGKHLGEMSMSGELHGSKADSSKHLNVR